VVGALVIGVIVVLVVGLLVADGGSRNASPEIPLWRAIVGFGLSAVGLVLLIVGLVRQFRAIRRMNAWRSPLVVLSGPQRKELSAAVRGQRSIDTARLPLGRHLAGNLLEQRHVLVLNLRILVMWAGLLIVEPTWMRVAITGTFVVFVVVGGAVLRRTERRARRFLETHPLPDNA
jgi:hypothetical protein